MHQAVSAMLCVLPLLITRPQQKTLSCVFPCFLYWLSHFTTSNSRRRYSLKNGHNERRQVVYVLPLWSQRKASSAPPARLEIGLFGSSRKRLPNRECFASYPHKRLACYRHSERSYFLLEVQWAHPQPRPFPAVIGRYHKRRPARGLVKGLVSIPLRLSFFFKKVVVCGHSLVVTLSLTINGTLKWLSSLPILMQESFRWWQCSERYNSLPRPPPP